ncbi:MAG: hypothetical protein AAB706_03715 [Patescibacteria group bacterium]
MKNSQKGFLVPMAIAAGLLIIGGGLYFYVHSQNQETRLKTALATAKAIALTETETLESLEQKFAATYPLHALVQEQYSNMNSIVQNTNFFFGNLGSSNPEIIVKTKNSSIKTDIETRRAKISALLIEWKKKAAQSLTKEVNAETIKEIKADARTIDAFINELSSIINALTPANSGLSQSEIAYYESIVSEAANQIDNVIIALAGAQSGTVSTSNTVAIANTPQEIQAQIEAQIIVVAKAEAIVATLEGQLAATQTPVEVTTSTGGSSGTQGTQSDQTQSGEIPNPILETILPPADPITVTPGPPELIQGTNKD